MSGRWQAGRGLSRREFLSRAAAVPLASSGLAVLVPDARQSATIPGPARPAFHLDRAAALLRRRFPHLWRHFAFEYYPWYAADPWRHWDAFDRRPPVDLAATSVPRLGAYDSRAQAVLERHARWIADAGVGAVNVSWWGPDSFEDRAVPLLMDVMRDHDIHVTFHLEPYRRDRVRLYARDVMYLLREYGERRRWDCLLFLERADGSSGPVFKSFATLHLPSTTDCHGITRPNPGWVPDGVWREQTDVLRRELAHDFDHLTLVADSLDFHRTRAAGFDGTAVFDPYVRPDRWPLLAHAASGEQLVFSFNINPGFDAVHRRTVEPGSCYRPPPFEPPAGPLAWTSADSRRTAQALAMSRIRESLTTTLLLQTDAALANVTHGFFLVYINSFNEWHEGTPFEPAKPWPSLTVEERRIGYHNADNGAYRLEALQAMLERIQSGLSTPRHGFSW